MDKKIIHTVLLGRQVRMNPAETFRNHGPQVRYFQRGGQQAIVANVYLDGDGAPTYDLLFEDGELEVAMYPFGFTVVT